MQREKHWPYRLIKHSRMRKQGRNGSVTGPRKWRLRGTPVPSLSPYWEVEVGPRRSLSPTSKAGDSGKPRRMGSPTGMRRFRVPAVTPAITSNPKLSEAFESEYEDCQARLSALQQAYTETMKERTLLLSLGSRPTKVWTNPSTESIAVPVSLADRSEVHSLSNEQEDLHAWLPSCHSSIRTLQEKHRSLACNLHNVLREIGVMKYQSELRASTSEVKGTLVLLTQLGEVISKRSEDLNSLSMQLRSLHRDKTVVNSAIINFEHEKEALVEKVANLQRNAGTERLNLAENCRQIAELTAKFRQNEEKIRALEEFIKSHQG